MTSSDRRWVNYPLAFAGTSDTGTLRVPMDLQKDEADRLCAMIQSLVQPWAQRQDDKK